MTEHNKKCSNNSTAALQAFGDRLENLVEQQRTIAADLSELKTEINSAGFSHRALKKIITAKLAADNGKPKALQDLREESGDLPLYLDILAPERGPEPSDDGVAPLAVSQAPDRDRIDDMPDIPPEFDRRKVSA